MNKFTPRVAVALIIIIFGVLMLFNSIFSGFGRVWELVWPVFVLFPALLLWSLWLTLPDPRSKNWGIVIPATILTSISALFFFNMFVTVVLGYPTIWAWTAFGYVASVALAFWVSYHVTGKKVLQMVSRILAYISFGIFLVIAIIIAFVNIFTSNQARMLWPVLIILFGVLVVLEPAFRRMMFGRGGCFGKTEEEWKQWGENVGKQFDDQKKQ